MIHVTIISDPVLGYVGLDMLGHAGNVEDPVEGQNLVCAAVSALTINMANSVEHFTDDAFEAEQEEETGRFHFRFTGPAGEGSQLLMNSLIFGLEDLEETYGEPYIKLHFKEV